MECVIYELTGVYCICCIVVCVMMCVCVCACVRVYQATVLAVLLYGAETWTLKAAHVRRLTTFHNHCVRTILGVTRYEQWQ